MMELTSVEKVTNPFAGILLDAYGVFWNGNKSGLIPGSKEVMEQLVRSGKVVGILSNSTQLASKEVSKFKKHGLEVGKHFHFVLTSGQVGQDLFKNKALPFPTPKNKFYLTSEMHPDFSSQLAIFDESEYTETKELSLADFIYISVPNIDNEDQVSPEAFRSRVQELVKSSLPMVCANPDLFAFEGFPPRAVVRQGSIAALYQEMGGEVFYIGKPFPLSFAKAMECFNSYGIQDPKKILMIGDTPETDIRGANTFGMSTALTIETGIMGQKVASEGEKAFCSLNKTDTPTYFIRRFSIEKL